MSDSYGKMRTCAYFPIQVLSQKDFKENHIPLPDGFEDDYFKELLYKGEINNEDQPLLIIPSIPEISTTQIIAQIDKIKKQLSKRVVQ